MSISSHIPGSQLYKLISMERAVLRKVASSLSLGQIDTDSTRILLRDMRQVMYQEDGIGIAGRTLSIQSSGLENDFWM